MMLKLGVIFAVVVACVCGRINADSRQKSKQLGSEMRAHTLLLGARGCSDWSASEAHAGPGLLCPIVTNARPVRDAKPTLLN